MSTTSGEVGRTRPKARGSGPAVAARARARRGKGKSRKRRARRFLSVLTALSIVLVLGWLIYATANEPGDWLELGLIVGAVLVTYAMHYEPPQRPSPRKRSFTRTSDSRW